MSNLCNFSEIDTDVYQCSKCGIVIDSVDGSPVFVCSHIEPQSIQVTDIEKELFCTASQIEHRYSICKLCEYFIDNTCLQCGCKVIRNAEFKNKLFFKQQSCPAGKWKQEN